MGGYALLYVLESMLYSMNWRVCFIVCMRESALQYVRESISIVCMGEYVLQYVWESMVYSMYGRVWSIICMGEYVL